MPSSTEHEISIAHKRLILKIYFAFKISNVVFILLINEPVHEISNNVVCATSKATDQPAHTRSLIGAFASRLSIL